MVGGGGELLLEQAWRIQEFLLSWAASIYNHGSKSLAFAVVSSWLSPGNQFMATSSSFSLSVDHGSTELD